MAGESFVRRSSVRTAPPARSAVDAAAVGQDPNAANPWQYWNPDPRRLLICCPRHGQRGELAMPPPNDETRALLALQLVPNLGPLRTKALIEHLGSARAVVEAGSGRLLQVPGIG